jgi:hypothetical protein
MNNENNFIIFPTVLQRQLIELRLAVPELLHASRASQANRRPDRATVICATQRCDGAHKTHVH